MPLFDFECSNCKEIVEIYQTTSENSSEIYCSECNNLMVKQPSFANFKFIGNGFYENDYKTKPNEK